MMVAFGDVLMLVLGAQNDHWQGDFANLLPHGAPSTRCPPPCPEVVKEIVAPGVKQKLEAE